MNEAHEVKILLVEDSDSDAELATHALKKHGLADKLLRIKNGAEAIDYLFAQGAYAARDPEQLPQLILLDLDLPVLPGIQVLSELKSHPSTRNIPVVVFTSSQSVQDVARCYKLGVNSYVNKPNESEEFSRVMAELGMYWMLVNHPPMGLLEELEHQGNQDAR